MAYVVESDWFTIGVTDISVCVTLWILMADPILLASHPGEGQTRNDLVCPNHIFFSKRL